jgi:hypothetical protein
MELAARPLRSLEWNATRSISQDRIKTMTPQEQQMLESFAGRIANTPAPQKDADADALIRNRIGSKPDALYILTQTALIQEIALNQANQRLHDLQQQINDQAGAAQPQHTSFLGRLFGSSTPGQQTYTQSQYAAPPPPPPQYAQQPQYAPQYAPAPGSGSSFLRSAAQTATGVAAGALAFEGIEALLGNHGGFGGGSFLGGGPGETVVNNYYEDGPRGNEGGDRFADSSYDDSQSNVDNSADVDNTDYSDANSDDFSGGGSDDSGNSSDV